MVFVQRVDMKQVHIKVGGGGRRAVAALKDAVLRGVVFCKGPGEFRECSLLVLVCAGCHGSRFYRKSVRSCGVLCRRIELS